MKLPIGIQDFESLRIDGYAYYRYVIEFLLGQASQSAERKLDGTAEEALQQIKDKQYTLQYELDSKKTFLIGMNFSNETRTIDKWLIE